MCAKNIHFAFKQTAKSIYHGSPKDKMLNAYQTDDDIGNSSIDWNIFICSSRVHLI